VADKPNEHAVGGWTKELTPASNQDRQIGGRPRKMARARDADPGIKYVIVRARARTDAASFDSQIQPAFFFSLDQRPGFS
jgi:hypothetical protein